MSFASTIFLTGLVAVGVPIAIHLLARQRTRVLNWGAMEFLRQSVSSATARRQRLRDILLLMLRVLAIIFLVLTFAQPLVSQLLFGGRQFETVFVWDVSLSTSALDEGGKPIQSAMKARLLEEIDRLPDASSVRILVAGADSSWLKPDALTLTSVNRQSIQRAIDEQPLQAGESNLANAVLRALALEDDANAPSRFRDIAVVHDFQSRAWQAEDETHWAVIQDRLASDPNRSLRAVDPGTRLDGNLPQVAVTDLAASRDTVAPETPARIQATVRNESLDVMARGDIVWFVDGREVDRSDAIEVAPNAELKLEQVVNFESLGCHQVACVFETSGGDLLPADNRAVCVVSTHEALPVLIIDDTELTQRGQIRPSEFLIAGLGGSLIKKKDDRKQPKKPKQQQPGEKSLFAPQVIRSADLRDEMLDTQLAVFVVAAQELADTAIESLERFVRSGGGLWLILDAQTETLSEWEVALLTQLGLEPLADTSQTMTVDGELPLNLKVANANSSFAKGIVAQSLDLYRAEVRAIRELNDPVVLREERLLETGSGLPVLLSLPVGKGRVLLQTTDLSRRNTNLPILQAFVPFVREIARETSGSSLPKRNLNQGGAIRINVASADNLLGAPELALPDGTTGQMLLEDAVYQSANTLQPGIYKVFDSQVGKPEEAEEFFAVSRPADESKLQQLSSDRLAALLQPKSSGQSMVGAEPKGKWPLAFWFAIAAALLFLSEALLARWIARKRAQRKSRLDLRPVF